MPYMVNGIGTWHYGKHNVQRRHSTCEHCGQPGTLESYDTSLYFVVFFIPVIPLGKYHLIDRCPACTQHRSMRLSQWQKARQHAIEETERRLRENPRDAESAREALAVCATFQEHDLLIAAAPLVRQHFREDAAMQLLLGQVYAHFGMLPESEEALRESIRTDDQPAVRESLAMNLINQGRPGDAASYLNHLRSHNAGGDVSLLLALAEGYQAVGSHSNSLHLLMEIAQVYPELKSDKTYKRLLKTAKKNQYSTKAIRSSLVLTPGTGEAKQASDYSGLVARIVSVLLLLGLGGGYWYWADYIGKHRQIYVVNGLLKPYRVRIDGQTVRAPSMQPMRTEIAEGRLKVEVEDPGAGILPTTVDITTSFWTRPFAEKVIVLNPDRTAPLIWEKTWYASNKEKVGNREREARAYIGQTLYTFKSVGFTFEVFPRTIRVQGGSAVSRTRIGLIQEQRKPDLFNDLMKLDHDEAVKVATLRSQVAPDNETYVNFLQMILKPEELRKVAKANLPIRPVRKLWHEAYQDQAMTTDPAARAALAREYAGMLAAESTNTALMFLAGRVAVDPAEAQRLMEGAATGEPPVGEAPLWLAEAELAKGRFDLALKYARMAAALLPDNQRAHWQLARALEATGDLKGALEELEKQRRGSRGYFFNALQAATLTARLESTTQGLEVMRKQFESAQAAGDGKRQRKMSPMLEKSYEATLAYAAGDTDHYLELTEAAGRTGYNFDYALTRGDLTSASLIVELWNGGEDEDVEEMDPDSALLLYIACRRAGNETSASRALELAFKVLSVDEGNDALQQFLRELRKDGNEDTTTVLELTADPSSKRVWLTAAGIKFPANRERYFTLARKLNFQTHFPHLFLKEVLGD